MRILVVNAGSSTLKLRVLDQEDAVVASDDLPAVSGRDDEARIAQVVGAYGRIDAAGHRIVHGGTSFRGPVLIDLDVESQLRELTELAPLHQPKSLAALDAVSSTLPDVPAVACFDTAFHAGLPAEAATYALPSDWRERWGLRRFGFHGLSHAYATRRAAELLGRPEKGFRVVTCHLGAGASLAAVQDGRSVDTTMGFTPLEGLVMATRSGSIDPGLMLWLEEHGGVSVQALAEGLERRSGLLGLAGTADMREILQKSQAGDPDSRLAIDVYVHRLVAGVAAMAGAMGGMEALVFTGGVGENAHQIRELAADRLEFLGVGLDRERNVAQGGDREIGPSHAPVRALVIEAREDLQIAREVRQLLER